MTKPQKMSEEWIPCPPGKLATLASHERMCQRRQFLVRAGSAVSVVALASGTGWLAFRGTGKPAEPAFGGIVCSRVHELAPQFMMGKLDQTVTLQIKTHLEQCAACRTLLESMQPKVSAHSPHRGSTGICQCSTCRRDDLVELLATVHSKDETSMT